MKRIVYMILALAVVMLGACSAAAPLTDESPYDRLGDIDAYKRGVPPRATEAPAALNENTLTETGFRGVPFGASMTDVMATEALPLYETYTNALDYGYIDVFGNEMHPAYWFNNAGQMYRGGYYMQTTDMQTALVNLDTELTAMYGEAVEYSFYTYAGELEDFATFEEGARAVGDGSAYYYIWFNNVITDIEVYAERAEASNSDPMFDVYVIFTDYTYYDYE